MYDNNNVFLCVTAPDKCLMIINSCTSLSLMAADLFKVLFSDEMD